MIFSIIGLLAGLVGGAVSRHLDASDEYNATVVIEDEKLLPGYGDKQVMGYSVQRSRNWLLN